MKILIYNLDCPCQYNCSEGCSGCDNPVCECEFKETNANWNACLDDNSSQVGRCLYACNGDTICESNCNDEFRERQMECPCEV